MKIYYYESYLMHHGIKGQKWGVRRFQNEDGTLTSAGEKRYSDSKDGQSKSIFKKHRENLVAKYEKAGYSRDAALTATNSRIKTEKRVAIAGGIALGIIATSAAVYIGREYCDKTFESGLVVQNINAKKDATFNGYPFYAAINKRDKKIYGGTYPVEKTKFEAFKKLKNFAYKSEGIFNNEVELQSTIKRASNKHARDIFISKMKSDSEFKRKVNEAIDNSNLALLAPDAVKKSKSNNKYAYAFFSMIQSTPEVQDKGLNVEFYNELKKHGYDAIIDINDSKYSGYARAVKEPTIFFGGNWKKIQSVPVDMIEINNNLPRIRKQVMAYKVSSLMKPSVAVSAAVVAKRNTNQQRIVEDYLSEHPNSKLSRREILDNYYMSGGSRSVKKN